MLRPAFRSRAGANNRSPNFFDAQARAKVMGNLKLAFGVFMSGEVKIARQLIAEKATLRTAELAAAESHLGRLRAGRSESIESSSLHLDVLRDLKRIHSHICSAAYPVLERAGALRPSRLRLVDGDKDSTEGNDTAQAS